MKTCRLREAFAAALLAAFAGTAAAQQTAAPAAFKVGAVDSQRVINQSRESQRLLKDLETEFAKREAEIARGPKGEVPRRMAGLVEDMNLRKEQLQKEFVDKANAMIKRIGQQENFDAVFLDPAYASPRVDLTDRVIKALDAGR